MNTFSKILSSLAVCVLVSGTANMAIAQQQDGGPLDPTEGNNGGPDDVTGSIGGGNTLGEIDGTTVPTVTVDIVTEINAIRAFCESFPWEVQIDCLSDRFRALADQIPNDPDFRPMKRALLEASRDLQQVSREFRAATPPRPYVAPSPVSRKPIRTKPLQPISPDKRAQATAKADAVIGQLQTKLLRSAENSRRRALAYQEVAAALNSTKVLLRSAELDAEAVILT